MPHDFLLHTLLCTFVQHAALSEGFHAACVANICCKHECCCSNLMAHAQPFMHLTKSEVAGSSACFCCPVFFWLLVRNNKASFLPADLGALFEIKFQSVMLQIWAHHIGSAGCLAWSSVDLLSMLGFTGAIHLVLGSNICCFGTHPNPKNQSIV